MGFDSTTRAWYPPKLERTDGLHHETDSLRIGAADTPLPNKSHPSSRSRAHVRLHRWNDCPSARSRKFATVTVGTIERRHLLFARQPILRVFSRSRSLLSLIMENQMEGKVQNEGLQKEYQWYRRKNGVENPCAPQHRMLLACPVLACRGWPLQYPAQSFSGVSSPRVSPQRLGQQ